MTQDQHNELKSKLERALMRRISPAITTEELERLAKYGSLEFKSAGAKRQLPPNYQDNGDGTFSMDW